MTITPYAHCQLDDAPTISKAATKTYEKLEIYANLWSDSHGNTYHIVKMWVDDEVYFSEYTYGYGDHYLQTALEMLQVNGYKSIIHGSTKAGISYDTLYWLQEVRESDNVYTNRRYVDRKKHMMRF